MKKPRLSIIVPSKGRNDLLTRCLQGGLNADAKTRHHCQVIVVETGDELATEVEGMLPEASDLYLHHPGAHFASAINAGLDHAQADLFLLLNNDVSIPTGQLYQMLQAGRRDATVGFRLLYPDSDLVQHAGIGFDVGSNPYLLWNGAAYDHPEVAKTRLVPAVTFACALLPRLVYETVGPLDEAFHNAYEDVDYCLRAREAGFAVEYRGDVFAYHQESQTAGRHEHDAESWEHFTAQWLPEGRAARCLGVFPFTKG